MSRYMDPELADQLMTAGDSTDIMGGETKRWYSPIFRCEVLLRLLKNLEHKVQLSF